MHATWVEVSAKATPAYWEDYAHQMAGAGTVDTIVLVTYRTGRQGLSDAQYIIDRMASGLHPARILLDGFEGT